MASSRVFSASERSSLRGVLLASVLATAACGGPDLERANIVLIVIDSLRADGLSSYGYDRQVSPNVDRFAQGAIRFRHAISAAPMTAPSMAAIMTGRLPYYTLRTRWGEKGRMAADILDSYGMSRFAGPDDRGLPHALDTLPEILQRNGYATAAVVTNAHVTPAFQFDQGFDDFFNWSKAPNDPGHYRVAEHAVGKGLEWLDGRDDAPFFLYIHLNDVHWPYLPPTPEERACYDYPRVVSATDEELQRIWALGLRTNEDLDHIEEHARGLYDCEIQYADRWLGVLFDRLDADFGADTITILTADHGEEFLDHGGTVHPPQLYDELLRVPLLMRVPGLEPRDIDALVRNYDLLPTLLDLVGIHEVPSGGAVSLRPLLFGEVDSLELAGYANLPAVGQQPHARMIRTDRFKLIWRPDGTLHELFDLHADPKEQTNLYTDEHPTAAALQERLVAIAAKLEGQARRNDAPAASEGALQIDPATRKQLEALGYMR